jgi:hypothetical protein
METAMTMRKAVIGAALSAVLLSTMVVPALAGEGGAPDLDSCGLGKDTAQAAIADQTSPGASEVARFPPLEAGCTGSKK